MTRVDEIQQAGNAPPTGYSPEQEADLVRFPMPGKLTPEKEALVADLVSLDHRSLNRLGYKSQERQEVKRLLWNAVNGLLAGSPNVARLLYAKAEQTYYDHIQIRNRLRYLLGMALGTAAAALLAAALLSKSDSFAPYVSPRLLLPILVFAGFGSITSVLARLPSIDLRQEPSDLMITISGATKPVVAIVLAIVVYLIIDLKIVDIHIGSQPADRAEGLYLVTSFLCGFSERFATDVIERVPFAGRPAADVDRESEGQPRS